MGGLYYTFCFLYVCVSECERRGRREGRGSGGSMRGSWRGSSLLPEWRGEEREREMMTWRWMSIDIWAGSCVFCLCSCRRERESVFERKRERKRANSTWRSHCALAVYPSRTSPRLAGTGSLVRVSWSVRGRVWLCGLFVVER